MKRSFSSVGVGVCSVCNKNPKKYRCPRCNCETCSLKCVKKHKAEAGCSGKRNKTAFVELRDMDDRQFTSDYHFVQDIDRTVDTSKRVMNKSFGGHIRYAKKGKAKTDKKKGVQDANEKQTVEEERTRIPDRLPSRVYRFKKEALQRGVDLRLMQHGMERRKSNTSQFHVQRRKGKGEPRVGVLYWRFEIVFPSAQHGEVRHVEEKVSESSTMNDIFDLIFTKTGKNAPTQHRLRVYIQQREELSVLMSYVDSPADAKLWYSLDCNVPFSELFRGKTIIEFPEIMVLLPKEKHRYNLKPVD
eukprot:g5335.t1